MRTSFAVILGSGLMVGGVWVSAWLLHVCSTDFCFASFISGAPFIAGGIAVVYKATS